MLINFTKCFPTRGKARKDMDYFSHFQYFTCFLIIRLSIRIGTILNRYYILYMPILTHGNVGNCSKNGKSAKKLKIFAKRFGSLKIVRTFAIPKQSGGGEMVDTLLWGGSGSNPVRVRVSPTAPQRKEENRKVFLFFIIFQPGHLGSTENTGWFAFCSYRHKAGSTENPGWFICYGHKNSPYSGRNTIWTHVGHEKVLFSGRM